MKIHCVGGGPGGLYFAILMKRAFPDCELTVSEKNPAGETFGWGVVFSKETLGNLQQADPESYAQIEAAFAYWDDIDTFVGEEKSTSTGHGFCGMARARLLAILQARAAALGVRLQFGVDVQPDALPQADLVLGCDGVHSPLRARFADTFKPTVDLRRCKFTWLGTTLPLSAFTFLFQDTPHGLFQVHAYPFEKGEATTGGARSTFIVECREEVWKAAGLEGASEADTVAFCERLFASALKGHKLIANKSIWRTFPTIRCEQWRHGNLVLLGDAAHTAHFSIGSGTKLAMEDAIALFEAFRAHGTHDVAAVCDAYEAQRKPEVLRIQKAAQTSLEWFENSARYTQQPLPQLTFNLMTRSKRITWDNLRTRDAALVREVDRWFAKAHGSTLNSDGSPPPPLFAPLTLRGLTLPNRVVVSPMCQYSATDGLISDWHLVHLGARAVGGAGLVMTEMTDVSPEGRITPGCAGLWNDAHQAAWKRVVDFVHGHSGARIGVQLAHAGRKGSCSAPWDGDRPLTAAEGAWETLGPSATPFGPKWHTPRAVDGADRERLIAAFAQAARRADAAGFDLVELHAAHGYLLSSFLSPLSNLRTDAYGGSLSNRLRFPLEVLDAVRAAWPSHKPISVRISATDWLGPQGLTVDDAVEVARALKAHGCDVVDVSTGGNVPQGKPEYGRMYQVPFAEAVRFGAQVPVMAVGAIAGADHANTVLAAGRADLVALARPHLEDPSLTNRHAIAERADRVPWPRQYEVVKPRR